MREFDWGRWCRLLASVVAATWVLLLIGAVIDSIDPGDVFSSGVRVRL